MQTLLPGVSMLIHIAAAWALGWVVGYERYFHGRASGTQVYCLVCMASCVMPLFVDFWRAMHSFIVSGLLLPELL